MFYSTDYAMASGAWQNSTAGYGGRWWLRSPYYYDSGDALAVSYFGFPNNGTGMGNDGPGVVPALCLEN